MYIFEILKPGTWLESDDHEWSWEVEGLLRNLESQFYEANLALNLFLTSMNQNNEHPILEQWQLDNARRYEIKKELENKHLNPYDHNTWDEIQLETEIRFKREKWSKGQLPREFIHNQPLINARIFLYALDSFDKLLKVLKNYRDVPELIADLHCELRQYFPDLLGVRNTAHHIEDRSRGLDASRPPQPLELKPVDNQMVKSDSGVLILNSLNGTKYGNTMANGHYGEVDVSPASMEILRSILQRLLDSFEWKGPKTHLPNT
ncbi:hypothetical protein J8Z83_05410 [Yersinia enterocolitica]|uniref:hypothetical protein n=1 Tax=Yersinia enterocolitica TaxID=630 RepID=UPI001C8E079C|nr:hypothetical protein [Yersinia enterocolitica]MBX9474142.1 hypothetical protein [Yersinia enterocolitica]